MTGDGMLVILGRFETEESCWRADARPEHKLWEEQLLALMTEQPVVLGSSWVDVATRGDPSQAGFVQVVQGRTRDPERARELMASDPTDWQRFRPEILGSILIGHRDGAWAMASYFTSEQAARAGEQKEPPPRLLELMKEMDSLSINEPVYHDLTDPWLHSPA